MLARFSIQLVKFFNIIYSYASQVFNTIVSASWYFLEKQNKLVDLGYLQLGTLINNFLSSEFRTTLKSPVIIRL